MTEYASKWEAAYANHLRCLQIEGKIQSFAYEPITFRLGVRCTYTPDFLVVLPDGRIEIHEVKGFMREDAAVKFKVAAQNNPWAVFVMVRKRGKTADNWDSIYRLNGESEIQSAATVPIATAKAKSVPMRMSYQQMMSNAEYAQVLKMAPEKLAKLRSRLGKTAQEMNELIGLPHPDSWEKLESGKQKLYYQAHVEALMKVMK